MITINAVAGVRKYQPALCCFARTLDFLVSKHIPPLILKGGNGNPFPPFIWFF
jgi:hypothetical protein